MNRDLIKYYLQLRRNGRVYGVRDAMRALGFTSPGKTQRLLNKMVKQGLLTRDERGNYIVNEKLPLELAHTMILRGKILPRILVYAVYSTVLAVLFIILTGQPLDVILYTLFLITPLWFEAILEILSIRDITK